MALSDRRRGERGETFTPIATSVINDSSISPSAIAIYVTLTQIAMDTDDDWIVVTAREIARRRGASVRSVKQWIQELEQRGAINVERISGAASRIRIVTRAKSAPVPVQNLHRTRAKSARLVQSLPLPVSSVPAGGNEVTVSPPEPVSPVEVSLVATSGNSVASNARDAKPKTLVEQLRALSERYRAAPDQSKRIGIAGETYALYFGKPNYARIGQLLTAAKSYDAFTRAVQTAAQRDPTDDPMSLVQTIIGNLRRTTFGTGAPARPVGVGSAATDEEVQEHYGPSDRSNGAASFLRQRRNGIDSTET